MPATDRLFFAVRPDAGTALRIECLAQSLRDTCGLRGRSLGPERFHVTLHLVGDFYGEVPPQLLDALLGAGRRAAAHASPFEVCFDSVASFARRRRNVPLVMLGQPGEGELAGLRQSLLAALAGEGVAAASDQRFTPHLTLLYDDVAMVPRPVEPVAWRVDALFAMRSLLGRGRHEVLARLPLGA